MTFSFKANEERDDVQVDATISCKKAPLKDVSTKLVIGRQNGEIVAVEQTRTIPGQLNMNGGEQADAKVINMGAKRA